MANLPWWDYTYKFRRKITLTATPYFGVEQPIPNPYCFRIDTSTFNLLNSNKYDVRFKKWNGSSWIDKDYTIYDTYDIFVKTEDYVNPNKSDDTYYIYYGNPVATDQSTDAKNIIPPFIDGQTLSLYYFDDPSNRGLDYANGQLTTQANLDTTHNSLDYSFPAIFKSCVTNVTGQGALYANTWQPTMWGDASHPFRNVEWYGHHGNISGFLLSMGRGGTSNNNNKVFIRQLYSSVTKSNTAVQIDYTPIDNLGANIRVFFDNFFVYNKWAHYSIQWATGSDKKIRFYRNGGYLGQVSAESYPQASSTTFPHIFGRYNGSGGFDSPLICRISGLKIGRHDVSNPGEDINISHGTRTQLPKVNVGVEESFANGMFLINFL